MQVNTNLRTKKKNVRNHNIMKHFIKHLDTTPVSNTPQWFRENRFYHEDK